MAWIWHMTVNLATEEEARAFADKFDHSHFELPHAGDVELRFGVSRHAPGWEVGIAPYVFGDRRDGSRWHLNDHGSAVSQDEVEDIDACAKVLYDRLGQMAGDGIFAYRFALTGFEVSEWRTCGELIDDLSPGGLYEEQLREHHGWDGLVISASVFEAAESPEGFVSFAGPYSWIPYSSVKLVQ
jgi:hypothetical protein